VIVERKADVAVEVVLVVEARASPCAVAKSPARPRIYGSSGCKSTCLVLARLVRSFDVALRLIEMLYAILDDILSVLRMRYLKSRSHPYICIPEDHTAVAV